MQPRLSRFPPVPLKARHDGWTPERQFRFISELAATKSIASACAAVGMSRTSAYTLRDRHRAGPEQSRRAAAGFAIAWREALTPEFAAGQRRSPRALVRIKAHRLRKLAASPKVDEPPETHDPPDSLAPRPHDRQLYGL